MSPENEKLLEEFLSTETGQWVKTELCPQYDLNDPHDKLVFFVQHVNKDFYSKEVQEEYKALGRTARDCTTEFYHAKMSVEDFYDILIDNKEPFIENMRKLGFTHDWPENWIQNLAAWSEMEKE